MPEGEREGAVPEAVRGGAVQGGRAAAKRFVHASAKVAGAGGVKKQANHTQQAGARRRYSSSSSAGAGESEHAGRGVKRDLTASYG